jgi:transcriptional regulator with XRE-family HTH domain
VPQSPQTLFGKKLRMIRLASRLSQEKLAEMADVHRNFVGCVERGEENLCLDKIVNLARALKVSPMEFFELFPKSKG